MKLLYFIPLFFIGFGGVAQTTKAVCCPEIEQALKQKDFQTSLKLIRERFDQTDSVAGDILYFYGQTLNGLNEYVRAQNAYAEYLKDSANQKFRKSAQQDIENLKSKICQYCQNTGYTEELSDCGKCLGAGHLPKDCNLCKKEGKLACSVCNGKGVLLKEGNMGKMFQECANCEGRGALICMKCEGKKMYNIPCDICQGQGEIPAKKVCTHGK